jgi:hypothetical protein
MVNLLAECNSGTTPNGHFLKCFPDVTNFLVKLGPFWDISRPNEKINLWVLLVAPNWQRGENRMHYAPSKRRWAFTNRQYVIYPIVKVRFRRLRVFARHSCGNPVNRRYCWPYPWSWLPSLCLCWLTVAVMLVTFPTERIVNVLLVVRIETANSTLHSNPAFKKTIRMDDFRNRRFVCSWVRRLLCVVARNWEWCYFICAGSVLNVSQRFVLVQTAPVPP